MAVSGIHACASTASMQKGWASVPFKQHTQLKHYCCMQGVCACTISCLACRLAAAAVSQGGTAVLALIVQDQSRKLPWGGQNCYIQPEYSTSSLLNPTTAAICTVRPLTRSAVVVH
jgi:hypothetical protein